MQICVSNVIYYQIKESYVHKLDVFAEYMYITIIMYNKYKYIMYNKIIMYYKCFDPYRVMFSVNINKISEYGPLH